MEFDPDALPIPALGLTCRRCGYLLDCLPQHRCPECGWQFEMDDLVPPGDFALVAIDGTPVLMTAEVVKILDAARILHIRCDGPLEAFYGLPSPINGRQWFRVPRGEYLYLLHLLRNRDQPIKPPITGPDWECSGCHEANPGTFGVCWSCGGDRPSPDDNCMV